MKTGLCLALGLSTELFAAPFGTSVQDNDPLLPKPVTASIAPRGDQFIFNQASLIENEFGELTGYIPAVGFLDENALPVGALKLEDRSRIPFSRIIPSNNTDKSAFAYYLQGDRIFMGRYRHVTEGNEELASKIYGHSLPLSPSLPLLIPQLLDDDKVALLNDDDAGISIYTFDANGSQLFSTQYDASEFHSGSTSPISFNLFSELVPAPDGVGSYLFASISEISAGETGGVKNERRQACLRLENDGSVRWSKLITEDTPRARGLSREFLPNGDLIYLAEEQGPDDTDQLVMMRLTPDGETAFINSYPGVRPNASFATSGGRLFFGANLNTDTFDRPYGIFEISPTTGAILKQAELPDLEIFSITSLLGASDEFLWLTIDETLVSVSPIEFRKTLVRFDLDLSRNIFARQTGARSPNASFLLRPDGTAMYQEMEFFSGRVQATSLDLDFSVGNTSCFPFAARPLTVTTPDIISASRSSLMVSDLSLTIRPLEALETRNENLPVAPFPLRSSSCRPILTPPAPVTVDQNRDGVYGISCPSQPGFTYELETTNDLSQEFQFREILNGDGTAVRFEIEKGPAQRQFFRIVERR